MRIMSHGISSGSSSVTRSRLSVEIHGAVQGVGFRPFVYRLATELGLCGWVINDARGVFIEVEGPLESTERFLTRLSAEIPPRAIVQSLDHAWLPPAAYEQFEIRHSQDGGAKTALILPDIATCPDCLSEIFDPADRRHGYPFTNCTNCGPRFTIIQALPYDRPNTTMRQFVMCPQCQQEYENPLDRRFHAQPNACPVCGPQISYLDRESAKDRSASVTGEGALQRAADALVAGRTLAVKGLGGFHLMCDARNDAALAALRERKPRPERPFAIMAPDLAWAKTYCEVPPEAETLLTSPEAPIVLLPTRGVGVSPLVAPGNPTLGVMLPYTPLHHLLLRKLGFPVVATSGNLSDEPICTDENDAVGRLGRMVDGFLVHDRPIQRHADDSVAWVVAGTPRLLRRARGYAPLPVLLRGEVPPILGVGPHLKNTISLTVGRQAFISQHIGDLETPEALEAFERVISDFLRLYEVTPHAIAHDLHPDYASTRWAVEQDRFRVPLIAVQHHHAHLAACLAENQVEGPALGITWDGTGFGTDGTIWGGEFLLGDAGGYERVAHLRPFVLPGGDAAVHEPRRVALALLYQLYGQSALGLDLAAVRHFSDAERRLLGQMLERGVNAPVTTSMGRLFDGVASLAGLPQTVTFEGQAAIRLEHIADVSERGTYAFALKAETQVGGGADAYAPVILDWEPALHAVIEDVRSATPPATIAARFHNGLVSAIVDIAHAVGQPRVVLTGGCFQNRLLTERATEALVAAGFEVLLHRQTPPNDGCVSLGQVAVAAAKLRGDVSCV